VKKVWVNGTFDVLHPGHIKLLEFAKQQGDYLMVGLDTDERIQQLKGPDRPIHTLEHRMFAIGSIKYVDDVVAFSSDDELRLLMSRYKPTIHVIGSDYIEQYGRIVGVGLAEDLVFFDRVWDYSSSRIINSL
jgi:D-beta-D-heptose 7-phosphate kinase/D-beta-D-heptose 1-phosphate adenosyltransferase